MRPWPLAAALAVLSAAALACAASARLAGPRLDLLHLSLYNACDLRSHEFHWQDGRRYPQPIRYNFVNSPDSVLLVALWLEDGPTLGYSRSLPLNCAWPLMR
jgi:hypothetical protein